MCVKCCCVVGALAFWSGAGLVLSWAVGVVLCGWSSLSPVFIECNMSSFNQQQHMLIVRLDAVNNVVMVLILGVVLLVMVATKVLTC